MKFKKVVFVKEMFTEDGKTKTFRYPYSGENLKWTCKKIIENLYNDSCIIEAESISYDYANDTLEIKIAAESTYNKYDIEGRVDILYNSIETLVNEATAHYTGYNNRMKVSGKLNRIGNGITSVLRYIIRFILIAINIPHMIIYFIFGVLQMIYKDRDKEKLKEKYKSYYKNLNSYSRHLTYEQFLEKNPISYDKYDLGVWAIPIEVFILACYVIDTNGNTIPPIAIIILIAYILISHIYSYKFVLNFFKKHNLI